MVMEKSIEECSKGPAIREGDPAVLVDNAGARVGAGCSNNGETREWDFDLVQYTWRCLSLVR
jgi:hypothetical protein